MRWHLPRRSPPVATAATAKATAALLGLCLGAAALSGCTVDSLPPGSTGGMVQVGSLTVQPVSWSANLPNFGNVMAVTDTADEVAVFGAGGAFVFNGGSMTGSDSSVTAFRDAAIVPALGLPGQWVLAVGGSGLLYRIQDGTTLEDVTQSYAMQGHPVRSVALLGGSLVAFGLDGPSGSADGTVAVTDGTKLSTYNLLPQGLVAGGGRLAVLSATGVEVLTPATKGLAHDAVSGAISAAFDASGHLVVATADAIYEESGQPSSGGLTKIFDSQAEPIHGLAAAGSGIWVAIADSLALLSDGQLYRGPTGQKQFPAGAQMVGSPSGDVWILSAGTLTRMTESGSASQDETLWRQTVLPVFNQVCRACHLPGGLANLDLSTYPEWAKERALIGEVILTSKPVQMPPAGTGALTAAELAAIKTWVNDTSM